MAEIQKAAASILERVRKGEPLMPQSPAEHDAIVHGLELVTGSFSLNNRPSGIPHDSEAGRKLAEGEE